MKMYEILNELYLDESVDDLTVTMFTGDRSLSTLIHITPLEQLTDNKLINVIDSFEVNIKQCFRNAQLLCATLGEDICKYVEGEALFKYNIPMSHAWNKVLDNGQWKYIDMGCRNDVNFEEYYAQVEGTIDEIEAQGYVLNSVKDISTQIIHKHMMRNRR